MQTEQIKALQQQLGLTHLCPCHAHLAALAQPLCLYRAVSVMLCLSPCVCHCICLGHAVCTTVSVGHFGSFFCFSCRMFMSLSHSSVTEIANHQGTGVCVKLQRLRADCHQALQQNQFLMQYITNGSQQFMAPAAATPLTRVAGTEPCRFSVCFSVSEALPICVVRLMHASSITMLPLSDSLLRFVLHSLYYSTASALQDSHSAYRS